MKKIAVLLGAVSIVFLTAPAQPHERVGQKIDLFGAPEQEYPANEPFNISHGWGLGPGETTMGLYDFDLEVDSAFRPHDFVDRIQVDKTDPPPLFNWLWVHNFPEGMTGTHTFTGHWFQPCRDLDDDGLNAGQCARPSETVEVLTLTVEVTFDAP
ncbi:MAG TPA: hypothetical protein VGC99_01455 [Candidatus Tectomicrobia bacterium]